MSGAPLTNPMVVITEDYKTQNMRLIRETVYGIKIIAKNKTQATLAHGTKVIRTYSLEYKSSNR